MFQFTRLQFQEEFSCFWVMSENPYESDELLQQYLIFHYGEKDAQFPYAFGGSDALGFPERCVSEGIDFEKISELEPGLKHLGRALDLGCAVGRSTFELARHFGEVIGIDFSQAFIDAANRMRVEGRHTATRLDEASATTVLSLEVAPDIDRSRVLFEQGDAQFIRADIGLFDVVIACNLICRLPDPMQLLRRLPDLIRPGGQLLITTPFTWMESYTPTKNWLSDGVKDSFEGLRSALEDSFECEKQWDMPFLIREHARKFQYSIAQASRWIRLS